VKRVNGTDLSGAKLLARLIIFVSVDGDDPWHPIKNDEVPTWLKDPDVIGRLVSGDMCSNGASWYRAEVVTAH